MKILLVSPPFYKPYSRSQVIADLAPLGLGLLGAYILRELPDVGLRLIDYGVDLYSSEIWENEIKTFQPDVVGLGVLSLAYYQMIEMSNIVRKVNKNIIVVVGGAHPTLLPEECLDYCDIAVRGEGEITIKEILSQKPLETIDGISYKVNGMVKHNKNRERISDLDSLPFPAHQLFELDKYAQYPSGAICGSRGCTFNCSFCASPELWGRSIKLRSPQHIVKEIELLYNLGIKHIVIQDDAINLSQQRAFAICDEIIGRKLNKVMTFECQARANEKCVSLEMMQKLKEANFTTITFGIESNSNKVLKAMNKNLTVRESRRALSLAHKAKIPEIRGYFMVGNWDENWGDILKTWWLVYTCRVNMILTVATPLPFTGFYRLLKEHGYIDKLELQNINWITALNRTNTMSKKSIQIAYYLTVVFVRLPSTIFWGTHKNTLSLLKNIVVMAQSKLMRRK